MAKRDLYDNIGTVLLREPVASTDDSADLYTSILDTAGFESAVISMLIGVQTGATTSHGVLCVLQESDTVVGTDFTAVASTDIHGAFTLVDSTSEDSVVQTVGYMGSKRYIRVKIDFTGTDITGSYIAALGILGHPHVAAATAPAAVTAT